MLSILSLPGTVETGIIVVVVVKTPVFVTETKTHIIYAGQTRKSLEKKSQCNKICFLRRKRYLQTMDNENPVDVACPSSDVDENVTSNSNTSPAVVVPINGGIIPGALPHIALSSRIAYIKHFVLPINC